MIECLAAKLIFSFLHKRQEFRVQIPYLAILHTSDASEPRSAYLAVSGVTALTTVVTEATKPRTASQLQLQRCAGLLY